MCPQAGLLEDTSALINHVYVRVSHYVETKIDSLHL